MNNLKNFTLALLAAGTLAACSSTRTSSGGSAGITGMGSGSSMETDAYESTDNGSGMSGAVGLNSTGITSDTESDSSDLYSGAGSSSSLIATGSSYGEMNSNRPEDNPSEPYMRDPNEFGYMSEPGLFTEFILNNIGNLSQTDYLMNGYQGPQYSAASSYFTSAENFLPVVSENGMRGLELSRIALQKASSPEVRAFAEMMVNDHSNSSQEVIDLALSKNVTIPATSLITEENISFEKQNNESDRPGTDTATLNEIATLQNTSGQQFDQQYMRMMLQDHYNTIALFTGAAQSNDPEVRAFAEKTLPVLRAHLSQASNIKY